MTASLFDLAAAGKTNVRWHDLNHARQDQRSIAVNSATEVPLTFAQRARLLVECLPVIFFTLALVFVLTRFGDITGAPPSLFLILFLWVVILIVGWTALNRIRDLVSGVVLVQEDVLERSWRSGRRSRSRPLKGKFTRLGNMRLTSNAYGQGHNGFRYRVAYSPASKIVWSLEPIV
jgi:hypothetical protein